MLVAYSRTTASGVRFRIVLAIGAGVLADRLVSFPRRTCDGLFAINDAEANWRDWQSTRVHAGFARRYRDPAFDALSTLDEVG
jgi:hypothetical protein